jgi:ribosomal protein L19
MNFTFHVSLVTKEFMNQALQDKIESEQYRKDDAKFAVGDTVRVHTKVVEGDKERIQIFSGDRKSVV